MYIIDLVYIYNVWTVLTFISFILIIFCSALFLCFIDTASQYNIKEEFKATKMIYVVYAFIFMLLCWIFLPGPDTLLNLLVNHVVCPGDPEQARVVVEEVMTQIRGR